MPHLEYYSGISEIKDNSINTKYTFYNIFRDTGNSVHEKSQKKVSALFATEKIFYSNVFKINLSSETHAQFFDTEKKLLETNQYHTELILVISIFGIKFVYI